MVPASGSRSSLLTPRLGSELGSGDQAYRRRTRRMAGTPVRAPLDRWTGRWGPTELGTCPGRERVLGSQHPDILRTREQLSRLTSRADSRPTPREHRPSRRVTGVMKDSAGQLHTRRASSVAAVTPTGLAPAMTTGVPAVMTPPCP